MTCEISKLVDAHFASTITPKEERTMRAHLEGCEKCRARYAKRALLARLDPDAPRPEDRIARGLGIGDRGKRARILRFAPMAGALLAAAALLLFLRAPRDDGFHARGGGLVDAAVPHVLVYRVAKGEKPLPAIDGMKKGDELAFAYENVAKKPYLMIFAIDDRGQVYWFHPAWTNEADDPKAIAASVEPGVHELREAVAHPFTGERVVVHAVFLDKPMSVRQIESMLRGGRIDIPGSVSETRELRIEP